MFSGANEETTNYARLLCLLVEQGTKCMKDYVLKNLPKNRSQTQRSEEMQSLLERETSLYQALASKKKVFDDLKNKRKISNNVYNQLFPPFDVPVNEDGLDMTCWYALARNLAVNKRRVNYGHFEANPPGQHQNLPQHNIIRIRQMRNTLFHLDSTQLKESEFKAMWSDLTQSLTSLGTSKETIEEYRKKDLNPMTSMTHYIKLREAVHQDLETVYSWEIKKKKHLLLSISLLGILLLVLALVSNCVTYSLATTWSSCINSMETHLTSILNFFNT